jgi:hypothetical protein
MKSTTFILQFPAHNPSATGNLCAACAVLFIGNLEWFAHADSTGWTMKNGGIGRSDYRVARIWKHVENEESRALQKDSPITRSCVACKHECRAGVPNSSLVGLPVHGMYSRYGRWRRDGLHGDLSQPRTEP